MEDKHRNPGNSDRFARGLAFLSLCIALAAVYYSRASSPYYYAAPTELSYWEWNTVDVEIDGSIPARKRVFIQNNGSTPSDEIQVRIATGTDKPKVTCNTKFEFQYFEPRSIVATIHSIPSGDTVELLVETDLSAVLSLIRNKPMLYGTREERAETCGTLHAVSSFGFFTENVSTTTGRINRDWDKHGGKINLPEDG